MNLIFGANNSNFELSHRENGYKPTIIKQDNLEKNLKAALKKSCKNKTIDLILYSSSMDHPEEYGVTREQVERFTATLHKIFGTVPED